MNEFEDAVNFHHEGSPAGFARSNPSWHLTAAGHRGCNRRVSWPPSLSLGRPLQTYENYLDAFRHESWGRAAPDRSNHVARR